MHTSLKSIFSAWKTNAMILLVLLVGVTLATLSDYASHAKTQQLLEQKKLAEEISQLSRNELEMANIQFRGKSAQIQFALDKLESLDNYDMLGSMLGQSADYAKALSLLQRSASAFTNTAEAWYKRDAADLPERRSRFEAAHSAFDAQIENVIEQDLGFRYDKFMISQFLVYLALLQALMMLMVHGKRFKEVQNDVKALFSVENESNYVIVTEEIDAIAKRMGRKSVTPENPTLIDQPTGLLNQKGVMHTFANRPQPKDGGQAQVMICIFQLDEFEETAANHPKEFTLNVIKKIAFIVSLYKQHSDIFGRLDDQKFVMIVNRPSKDVAFNEFEQMRENIAETNFKVPKGGSVNLTISGGFAEKNLGKNLDETIKEATQYLEGAQITGGNKILRNRIK